MEPNLLGPEDESMISSELQLDSMSSGIGRSYECVFCKRGFNTAQALGGHMNIHRKDRARNKPTSSSSSSNINSTNSRMQNPTCPPQLYVAPNHEPVIHVQFNSRTHFPASSINAPPFFANYHRGPNNDYTSQAQRFDPFGDHDNWRMGFSLPSCGPALVDDIHIGKSRRGGTQEEELDLELRLGS